MVIGTSNSIRPAMFDELANVFQDTPLIAGVEGPQSTSATPGCGRAAAWPLDCYNEKVWIERD
jgi:hypothetical protein